jgi:hypothetical protein
MGRCVESLVPSFTEANMMQSPSLEQYLMRKDGRGIACKFVLNDRSLPDTV